MNVPGVNAWQPFAPAFNRTPNQLPGASHRSPPGSYVEVPGPWHWRWVPVVNPRPGMPHYVRQRYRKITYVPAVPRP